MFNLLNDIPTHRTMEIMGGNGSVIGNIPLIINDDISIKCSSSFGPLWEGASSNLLTLLSGGGFIPSGQFALQGTRIWQSTEPLNINVTATLEMDKNPLTDVINPCITLMSLCLPSIGGVQGTISASIEGMIEKALNIKLETLIPPGPNILTIAKELKAGSLDGMNKGEGKAGGVFNVRIGWVTINKVIITSVEPTFSKEVCYVNGKPYPVSASLSIDISTLKVATVDMVSGLV